MMGWTLFVPLVFQGAFSGLLIGMVLGLIRMVLDFIYMQPRCNEPDNRPAVVKYVHYLYFSIILSLVTLVVVVVVSLLTEPPPDSMVKNSQIPKCPKGIPFWHLNLGSEDLSRALEQERHH